MYRLWYLIPIIIGLTYAAFGQTEARVRTKASSVRVFEWLDDKWLEWRAGEEKVRVRMSVIHGFRTSPGGRMMIYFQGDELELIANDKQLKEAIAVYFLDRTKRETSP